MSENVQIERSNGILTLTLARPDKKNALTNEMYGKLADQIEGSENDPAVRVIQIRGKGDTFTAGNDVAEFSAIAAGTAQGERHVSRFIRLPAQSVWRRMAQLYDVRHLGRGEVKQFIQIVQLLRPDCLLHTSSRLAPKRERLLQR
jgi:enoyl-CoA hydratase/carnithine racemase